VRHALGRVPAKDLPFTVCQTSSTELIKSSHRHSFLWQPTGGILVTLLHIPFSIRTKTISCQNWTDQGQQHLLRLSTDTIIRLKPHSTRNSLCRTTTEVVEVRCVLTPATPRLSTQLATVLRLTNPTYNMLMEEGGRQEAERSPTGYFRHSQPCSWPYEGLHCLQEPPT